jgi:hypothetical protein
VQVLGVDLWNGNAGQLSSFRTVTGATFPLLLNGASATGGNVQSLYGTYDNYVVVNKQGIVRYHAALTWPAGNRYHLDEIRGCVDSLVSTTTGVDDRPSTGALALSAAPNPVREATRLSFTLPAAVAHAELGVYDVRGRRVATLWNGPAMAGRHAVTWRTDDARGEPLPPGVYAVVADIGDRRVSTRVAVVR